MLLVHLLPLAGGVALLAAWPQPWAPLAFLLLAGVTNAWGGLLRTTLATDLAGVSRVGAARSQIAALMVVSTAAGPSLVGLVLGLGTRAGARRDRARRRRGRGARRLRPDVRTLTDKRSHRPARLLRARVEPGS